MLVSNRLYPGLPTIQFRGGDTYSQQLCDTVNSYWLGDGSQDGRKTVGPFELCDSNADIIIQYVGDKDSLESLKSSVTDEIIFLVDDIELYKQLKEHDIAALIF